MWQLFKRDFLMLWPWIGLLFFLLFIIYFFQLPGLSLAPYTTMFILFFVNSFYNDKKSRVNQFLISLPVKRNHLVAARYLFFLFACTLILFLDQIVFQVKSVSGITFLFMFTLLSMTVAASIPVYYLFDSIWQSGLVHFIILFVGSFAFFFVTVSPYDMFDQLILFALNVISIQPVIVLLLVSAFCLYGSYLLSSFIFSRKDIV